VKRREFITILSGAVAWPLAARAQQSAMPVVGFLGAQTPELFASRLRAFRQGLGEAGYVEGNNVAIEYRWAQGNVDRLPALAAELSGRQVAVIATSSTASAFAARKATNSIPIVITVNSDPMQLGLVDSLSRPGGNITGSTGLNVEVGPKRLELLRELLPGAKVMALLVHPANPGVDRQINDHQAAAGMLGLQLHVVRAGTEDNIESAIASLAQLRVEALVIGSDNFFSTHNRQLATATLRYRLPAVYQDQPFVVAGGLMSYGGSITDQYRITGIYAGRILKGEKPGDLPVQQSAKVDLIINMKTAKTLGLTFPISLLGRADEVIE
jgi:putative tryptophan/tyrosine transport system substrate-binding protein